MKPSKNTATRAKPESQRAAAARLTQEFRDEITKPIDRETVRRLIDKGIDLQDIDAIRRAFGMMERSPLKKKIETETDASSALDAEIEDIKAALLNAESYEEARLHATKLKGLKDLQSLLVSRGELVTRESQAKDAIQAAGIMRPLILKIPNDIPPMIAGMSSSAMVEVLTVYADGILASLADASAYFTSE